MSILLNKNIAYASKIESLSKRKPSISRGKILMNGTLKLTKKLRNHQMKVQTVTQKRMFYN